MAKHCFSLTAALLFLFFVNARALTRCYDEIGCFDNGYPFYDPPGRPVSYLPENRERVGTEFRLNTPSNSNANAWQELSTYDESTITNSYFDGSKETKIIIHGFTQSANVDWMHEMMTAFLRQGQYNVIRVDWRAIDLYGVSCANIRIVGAEISLLIDLLKKNKGVSANSFHIIGHSLGAHAAGYAGERQTSPQVARITGLDPAGPYFENTDPVVRLDPTDAAFVDVIHSDTDPIYTLGYGMYAQCGHMDFYPNGGRAQPGCDQSLREFVGSEGSLWDGTTQFVACNHLRAIEYFTESITSACSFISFECTRDIDRYNDGNCFDHGAKSNMGWKSPLDYPGGSQTALTYLRNTQSTAPYCGYEYRFTIKFDSINDRNQKDHKGKLFVTLKGSSAWTNRLELTSDFTEYTHGNDYMHVVISDVNPGTINEMEFEWDYDGDWYKWWDWELFKNPKLFINQIDVEGAENADSYTMCLSGNYDGLEPNTEYTFDPKTSCS